MHISTDFGKELTIAQAVFLVEGAQTHRQTDRRHLSPSHAADAGLGSRPNH